MKNEKQKTNDGFGKFYWQYCQLKITPNSKILLTAISALAAKTGYCTASNDYLCSLLNLSEKTIDRSLIELRGNKLIDQECKFRKVDTKKVRLKCRYIFLLEGGQFVHSRGSVCPKEGGQFDPDTIIDNIIDNNIYVNPLIKNEDLTIEIDQTIDINQTNNSDDMNIQDYYEQLNEYQNSKEQPTKNVDSIKKVVEPILNKEKSKYGDFIDQILSITTVEELQAEFPKVDFKNYFFKKYNKDRTEAYFKAKANGGNTYFFTNKYEILKNFKLNCRNINESLIKKQNMLTGKPEKNNYSTEVFESNDKQTEIKKINFNKQLLDIFIYIDSLYSDSNQAVEVVGYIKRKLDLIKWENNWIKLNQENPNHLIYFNKMIGIEIKALLNDFENTTCQIEKENDMASIQTI